MIGLTILLIEYFTISVFCLDEGFRPKYINGIVIIYSSCVSVWLLYVLINLHVHTDDLIIAPI